MNKVQEIDYAYHADRLLLPIARSGKLPADSDQIPAAGQRLLNRPGRSLVESIGARLRTIRQQRQLSLREVEERSLRFAQERGKQSYQVSASWLDRLEREEHELTVNKLIVLADIYNLPREQLLRAMHPADAEHLSLRQLSSPNATMLLTEGPLDEQARYLFADTLAICRLPDETTLLAAENSSLLASYRRGIIGKGDRTLDPMIPPGSIVQIDTQKRAISSRRDWTHEFQRPIYFLTTRDSYVCGWCELDRKSDWLTLIPHPLSPASSRRWRYRKEIENMGRVVLVSIRLTE
jgi:transcriptional regulator with XRE-family HTH domain